MLKKSTAVAVLVLLLSSLTIGSMGQEKAGVDAASTFKVSRFMQKMQGTAAARNIAFTGIHAGPTGIPGNAASIGPGTPGVADFAPGNASGATFHAVDREFTTMVLYMNDSWMEVPGPQRGEYDGRVAWAVAGYRVALEDPDSEKVVIHGKAVVFRPGREKPETFEVTWKNIRRASATKNGSFALFSARMIVPPWAACGEAFTTGGAFPGIAAPKKPMPREIEFGGDMMLDLTKASDLLKKQEDSQYNNEIYAGQTGFHKVDVSSAITSLNVDVKWKDPDSELRLVIYTPDGQVLGAYDDSSDGKDDGRINMNISNEAGLAMGEWYLKVAGTDVAGKDEYYVKTY